MEKTAEMTLAEALSSIDSTQEKLAVSFRDMKIDELEELLKKEAGVPLKKKSEMVKMSAEEKILMADQWGRELARDIFKKEASIFGKPLHIRQAEKAMKKSGKDVPLLPNLWKDKKSSLEKDALSVPPGVSNMLSKAAPTISKGLQSAGKALGGTSMKGRAIAGGAIGALGGAMKSPGVDPATGQQKSRLTGALAGAGVGAAGGAMAPKMVSGAQGLMGKLAK